MRKAKGTGSPSFQLTSLLQGKNHRLQDSRCFPRASAHSSRRYVGWDAGGCKLPSQPCNQCTSAAPDIEVGVLCGSADRTSAHTFHLQL